MDWEHKVKQYLRQQGYIFLEIEYELVFYRDNSGKVWGSSEESMAQMMMQTI